MVRNIMKVYVVVVHDEHPEINQIYMSVFTLSGL